MSLDKELAKRSEGKCELCSATDNLRVYMVPPFEDESFDRHAYICQNCVTQIDDPAATDANHWRCLNESMWSEVPAVKVLAYRMLKRLRSEGWPQDLLDMIYLTDEELAWAKSYGDGVDDEYKVVHKDANGAILNAGDTVTLIKDLDVKGGNFTAKRGTTVKNISLDPDNEEYIEGKVDGQKIVIVTKFVKKQ